MRESNKESFEDEIHSMLEKVMTVDDDYVSVQGDGASFVAEDKTTQRDGRQVVSQKLKFPPGLRNFPQPNFINLPTDNSKRDFQVRGIGKKYLTMPAQNNPIEKQQQFLEGNWERPHYERYLASMYRAQNMRSGEASSLFPSFQNASTLDGSSQMYNCKYEGIKGISYNLKYPGVTNNVLSEQFLPEMKRLLAEENKLTDTFLIVYDGNIFVEILRSQNGSRILQQHLDGTSHEVVHKIFVRIFDFLNLLILDPYANYFCQKLFSHLDQEDRLDFLKMIFPNVPRIAMSKIGTYPLQGIIELLNSAKEKQIIIAAIKCHILDLSRDVYGTHVVEKVIACFDTEMVGFIHAELTKNLVQLANHSSGLCVVKKLLVQSSDASRPVLVKVIKAALARLIQNPFGNYAVQVCIENWPAEEVEPILMQLVDKLTNLSMQKYSSNVVEKCIERSKRVLNAFTKELARNDRIAGTRPLKSELMKSNFGNYVVQKMLKVAQGEPKSRIISLILKDISRIRDKKLITKWRNILKSHIISSVDVSVKENISD